ncbi:MAG: cytochrome b/b6 domain-containing protein [Rhodospirillales bacterium]
MSVLPLDNSAEHEADYENRRVWDLPTRLFHWSLVICVTSGWLLGENMTFSTINWHFWLGYTTGGLLVFRLIWGFVGPPHARFKALLPTPAAVRDYLAHVADRRPSGVAGHNPLGALSVLAMLATLTVQVVSGLMSESDDFFDGGPLSSMVPDAVVRAANEIHAISSSVLIWLVGLHVAALVFYLVWKRENLIRPMVTGIKKVRR